MQVKGDRATTRPWLRQVGWLGLWLVVAAVVVLPYVKTYRHLSPFDEWVHVDYVVKAQHLELVDAGEKVGQVTMREQACRRSDLDMDYPRCRTKRFDPDDFPGAGFNTAYPDPPVYYWTTAAVATVVERLPGVDSVVTAARSVGVLWLGAGLWLSFLLSRRLGATTTSAAGVTLLLATTPSVTHAMATVTSDAPMLIVGAGLTLAAVGTARSTSSWWWLVVAAAFAAGVKATSLTAIGMVLLFLLLHLGLRSRRRTADRSAALPDLEPETLTAEAGVDRDPASSGLRTPGRVLRAFAGVSLATVLVLGGWSLLNVVTAIPGVGEQPFRVLFHVDSLAWQTVLSNVPPLVSPAQFGYEPPFMAKSATMGIYMYAFNLLLIVGVVGAGWAGTRATEIGRLGLATTVAMVVSGPALVVIIYLGSQTYIPIPSRYGMPLLPAAAACLAWAASQRRYGGALLLGFAALTLASLLVTTF